MLLKSNKEVQRIEFKNISKTIYSITLRTDIIEKDGIYTYNQYKLVTTIEDQDIIGNIEKNFDKYLEIAIFNDKELIKEETIKSYKRGLDNLDYKTLKTLETRALGLPLTGDYCSAFYERQKLRDSINNIEQEPENIEETELKQTQQRKIKELKAQSLAIIESGTEVNGERFPLTNDSKIFILFLYLSALNGKSSFYHSEGNPCRLYSPEEICKIVEDSSAWIFYHETYFNLLQCQILEMTDLNEIELIQYGQTLEPKYQKTLDAIATGSVE